MGVRAKLTMTALLMLFYSMKELGVILCDDPSWLFLLEQEHTIRWIAEAGAWVF